MQMLRFLKRKTKVEYVVPEFYKDWGNANYELETLGHRLDSVRRTIEQLEAWEKPENDWALRHWREAEAVILRKWKHTVRLKDTGLRQKSKLKEGPEIDYHWWEGDDGMGGPLFPWMNFANNWFNHSDLSASWDKAIQNRLEMARKGLA